MVQGWLRRLQSGDDLVIEPQLGWVHAGNDLNYADADFLEAGFASSGFASVGAPLTLSEAEAMPNGAKVLLPNSKLRLEAPLMLVDFYESRISFPAA